MSSLARAENQNTASGPSSEPPARGNKEVGPNLTDGVSRTGQPMVEQSGFFLMPRCRRRPACEAPLGSAQPSGDPPRGARGGFARAGHAGPVR